MISALTLNHKLRLQSKFLANSLNLPQAHGKDLLARAIYCTPNYDSLTELLFQEMCGAKIFGTIQHHWLKYLLICECEDELLIDDLHKSIEFMAKRLEGMVVINVNKIRLISILYELFGLGDESKYIIAAPQEFSLEWKPYFKTLNNNEAILYSDFKINQIAYRLIATTFYPKNFRENNFDESLIKNLKQDNEDSELGIAEFPFIEDHKSWFLNSVNFFTNFDSFCDDEVPYVFHIEGKRYAVYGFPLSPSLTEEINSNLPTLKISIKNISEKQVFIFYFEQQRLIFECIHVETPAMSMINYCEFSNGIKETLLNHKDARKFPIILHQSYFSASIRPFCDMDYLENSI